LTEPASVRAMRPESGESRCDGLETPGRAKTRPAVTTTETKKSVR
jgi:hypothetical protein